MNLVIDYGNSAAKVGIFDGENLVAKHTFAEEQNLQEFLHSFATDHIIISSVKTNPQHISSWLENKGKTFILDPSLPLPVTNKYRTPQTLGVDRLAAACGAQYLFPGKNCLAIDAGTCITYEFVDLNGNYYGGGISPGLRMRFQAVHTFTARLPLISPAENPKLIGDSTETCIQSGVVFGLIAEIEGIIDRYASQYKDLQVILCGRDTPFFENKLKASIFASPELVLVGLNSILIHNVNL